MSRARATRFIASTYGLIPALVLLGSSPLSKSPKPDAGSAARVEQSRIHASSSTGGGVIKRILGVGFILRRCDAIVRRLCSYRSTGTCCTGPADELFAHASFEPNNTVTNTGVAEDVDVKE